MEMGRTKIKIANSLERKCLGFPFLLIFSLTRKKRKNINYYKKAIGRLLAYLNLFSTKMTDHGLRQLKQHKRVTGDSMKETAGR